MTRLECEKEILKHIVAIANIYKEYNPDGNYLDLTVFNHAEEINGNQSVFVGNDYYKTGVPKIKFNAYTEQRFLDLVSEDENDNDSCIISAHTFVDEDGKKWAMVREG